MQGVNKKEIVPFRKKIPAGGNETLKVRIKASGIVERMSIRFYPGQQGTLHVNPYVRHSGNRIESLATFPDGADQYFSGDDDKIDLPVSITVFLDDELEVFAENTGDYEYTLVCDIVIQYIGGN